jgi:hypothetical protein
MIREQRSRNQRRHSARRRRHPLIPTIYNPKRKAEPNPTIISNNTISSTLSHETEHKLVGLQTRNKGNIPRHEQAPAADVIQAGDPVPYVHHVPYPYPYHDHHDCAHFPRPMRSLLHRDRDRDRDRPYHVPFLKSSPQPRHRCSSDAWPVHASAYSS